MTLSSRPGVVVSVFHLGLRLASASYLTLGLLLRITFGIMIAVHIRVALALG